jgi:hypothetical protein
MGLMKRALEDLSNEMGFEGFLCDDFLERVTPAALSRVAATPRHQERLRRTIEARKREALTPRDTTDSPF